MIETFNCIRLENVSRIQGFTPANAVPGQYAWHIVNGFVSSDEKEFYKYINDITSLFHIDALKDEPNRFLVIVHNDTTGAVFIDDFGMEIEIVPNKSLKIGDVLSREDIVDIGTLRFRNIKFLEHDSVIFCFRIGWKFGLYFNIRETDDKGKVKDVLDVNFLHLEMGKWFRHLSFKEVYEVISSTTVFEQMLTDGWFPFIQLIGNEYELLSRYYSDFKKTEDANVFEECVNHLVNGFDEKRIISISDKWWGNSLYNDKQILINAGIKAYLTNGTNGFINCINSLYPQIEGVLRINCFKEKNIKKPTFPDLVNHIKDKAENNFPSKESLGFPRYFYKYLNDVFFKGFDLDTGNVFMSRHSLCHGVVDGNQYTKIKAFQAILILDQIFFFLK